MCLDLPGLIDDLRLDAHSRSYGYRSPGGRSQYPPPYPNRRAPPDPHSFDYQASLKQYADWFRYYYPQQAIEEDNLDKAAEQDAGDGSKPRNGIKAKWEKYKKDFTATQVGAVLFLLLARHVRSPCIETMAESLPVLIATNDVRPS